MPAKQKSTNEILEELLTATQNLFILQALDAGAGIKEIRAVLGIGEARVNDISKIRKRRAGKSGDE